MCPKKTHKYYNNTTNNYAYQDVVSRQNRPYKAVLEMTHFMMQCLYIVQHVFQSFNIQSIKLW